MAECENCGGSGVELKFGPSTLHGTDAAVRSVPCPECSGSDSARTGISLRTAIKRQVEQMRAMAGENPGASERGMALDYQADQLTYLLDTESDHREHRSQSDYSYDSCPWCCHERPKAERLSWASPPPIKGSVEG